MSVEKVARGYKTTCLMDFETSFGVAPDVAAEKLLPINSFGLNVSRAKNSSATLSGRRDPVEPYDGNTEVTGSLAVPVDARAFPYWLKLLLGAPTSTGTGDPAAALYTHVFKPGDEAPSAIIQSRYGTSTATFGKFTGCKVSSIAMQAGGDGELTATVNVTGRDVDYSETDYNASAESVVMKRFSNFQASLKSDGVEVATVTDFSLTLDNGLDTSVRTIGSGGKLYDIPEGIMSVTGSMTALFTGLVMLNKAKGNTELSLELGWSIDEGNKLSFKLPEVQMQFQGPTVDGPTGVKAEYPFVAYFNDAADNACIIATVVNDVASY